MKDSKKQKVLHQNSKLIFLHAFHKRYKNDQFKHYHSLLQCFVLMWHCKAVLEEYFFPHPSLGHSRPLENFAEQQSYKALWFVFYWSKVTLSVSIVSLILTSFTNSLRILWRRLSSLAKYSVCFSRLDRVSSLSEI